MPSLVGVRVLCDGCRRSQAKVYNVTQKKALCKNCDERCNREEKLKSYTPNTSRRIDLCNTVTGLGFCGHCDRAPATAFCETRVVPLCASCEKERQALHTSCKAHVDIRKAFRSRTLTLTGTPPSVNQKVNAKSSTKPSSQSNKSKKSPKKRRRTNSILKFSALEPIDNAGESIVDSALIPSTNSFPEKPSWKSRGSFPSVQNLSELSASNDSLVGMDFKVTSDVLVDGLNFESDTVDANAGDHMVTGVDSSAPPGGVDFNGDPTTNYLNLPLDHEDVPMLEQQASFPSNEQAKPTKFENGSKPQGRIVVPNEIDTSSNMFNLNSHTHQDNQDPVRTASPSMIVDTDGSLAASMAAAITASREMDALLEKTSLAQQERRISMQATARTKGLSLQQVYNTPYAEFIAEKPDVVGMQPNGVGGYRASVNRQLDGSAQSGMNDVNPWISQYNSANVNNSPTLMGYGNVLHSQMQGLSMNGIDNSVGGQEGETTKGTPPSLLYQPYSIEHNGFANNQLAKTVPAIPSSESMHMGGRAQTVPSVQKKRTPRKKGRRSRVHTSGGLRN